MQISPNGLASALNSPNISRTRTAMQRNDTLPHQMSGTSIVYSCWLSDRSNARYLCTLTPNMSLRDSTSTRMLLAARNRRLGANVNVMGTVSPSRPPDCTRTDVRSSRASLRVNSAISAADTTRTMSAASRNGLLNTISSTSSAANSSAYASRFFHIADHSSVCSGLIFVMISSSTCFAVTPSTRACGRSARRCAHTSTNTFCTSSGTT